MGNSTLTDPERNYYMVFFFSARKDEQRKYEESSTKEISKVLSLHGSAFSSSFSFPNMLCLTTKVIVELVKQQEIGFNSLLLSS
jgi:hypothetical protein